MAARRADTLEGSEAAGCGCGPAPPGALEPSSNETPTNPAGSNSAKILRYLRRSDIHHPFKLHSMCYRVSDETVTAVKPGRRPAPRPAPVRESGHRPDTPARALPAGSQGSSGIR